MTKFKNILILLFLSLFLAQKTINAASIEINEIQPNPNGKDKNHEWLELKNSSKQDIDLTNWQITNNKKAAKLKAFIKAGEVLILEGKNLKISLKNKGDEIKIIDNYGKTVDQVKYQAVLEGQSYSKTIIKNGAKAKTFWQWTNPTKNKNNQNLYILNGEVIEKFNNQAFKIKTAKNNILTIHRKSNSNDLLMTKLLIKGKKIKVTIGKSASKLFLKKLAIL